MSVIGGRVSRERLARHIVRLIEKPQPVEQVTPVQYEAADYLCPLPAAAGSIGRLALVFGSEGKNHPANHTLGVLPE